MTRRQAVQKTYKYVPGQLNQDCDEEIREFIELPIEGLSAL